MLNILYLFCRHFLQEWVYSWLRENQKQDNVCLFRVCILMIKNHRVYMSKYFYTVLLNIYYIIVINYNMEKVPVALYNILISFEYFYKIRHATQWSDKWLNAWLVRQILEIQTCFFFYIACCVACCYSVQPVLEEQVDWSHKHI